MLCSFEFDRIERNDQGTKVFVRFYSGDITTEQERDIDGKSSPDTRYRPKDLILETVLNLPADATDEDCNIASELELTKIDGAVLFSDVDANGKIIPSEIASL